MSSSRLPHAHFLCLHIPVICSSLSLPCSMRNLCKAALVGSVGAFAPEINERALRAPRGVVLEWHGPVYALTLGMLP